MVKLTYLGASGEDKRLIDNFSIDNGMFATAGKTSATWVDSGVGSQITFEGTGLTFHSGVLVSGHITKILFEDVEDADIARFSGDFNTKKLGADLAAGNVLEFVDHILNGPDVIKGSVRDDHIVAEKGNDIIRGGSGNDFIRGGLGNDRIYGGAGSDTFLYFTKVENITNDGNDTIMDFDAKGGGKHQDHIAASWDDVKDVHKHDHDTVIDFHGGGSITLVDVKASQIDEHDFVFLI